MVNVKKELQFGFISIFLICLGIAFDTVQYNKNIKSLENKKDSVYSDSTVVLTPEEVSKHNNANDCWIIIENKVYVASDFLSRHPGGGGFITPYCGKDATQPFLTKDGRGSHSAEAFRILGLLYIGDINGKITKQPDTKSVKTIQIDTEEDDE